MIIQIYLIKILGKAKRKKNEKHDGEVVNMGKFDEPILMNEDNTMGIGILKDKKGYQSSLLDTEKLRKALDVLEEWSPRTKDGKCQTYIHVKNHEPIMIGTKKLGVIIAQMVDNDED